MPQYNPTYTKSYALVMGIDSYKEMPPLSAAVRGAKDLADILQDQLGFETTLLLNKAVTRAKVFDWLNAVSKTANIDDRVLIYYAGHGLTRGDGLNERGYLALQNSKPDKWHTMLAMDDVLDESRYMKVKHLIYLLDCCFGGIALDTRAVPSTSQEVDYYLTRPVRYAITAGGREVVDDALAPGFEHSLFTYHLIKWLTGESGTPPDGIWRARELGNYLERAVARNRQSGHKPHHNHLSGSGDGDFIFRWENQQAFVTQGLTGAMKSTSWQVRKGAVDALITMARGDDPARAAYAFDWLERIANEDSNDDVRRLAENFINEESIFDTRPIDVMEARARQAVLERPTKPMEIPKPRSKDTISPSPTQETALLGLTALGNILLLLPTLFDGTLAYINVIADHQTIFYWSGGVVIGVAGVGYLIRYSVPKGLLYLLPFISWVPILLYKPLELYDTSLWWLEDIAFVPVILSLLMLLIGIAAKALDKLPQRS